MPVNDLLVLNSDWMAMNERRVQMAGHFLAENDELLDLLGENLRRVEFNRYNLELYIGIARLYRQNLKMLLDLERINAALGAAQAAAAKADVKGAVTTVDQALDLAERIRQQRNQAFADAVATWYKSWYPRIAAANGRRFLDQVDDVKDHLPVRTVDMTYLIYRQILYPLGEWASNVQAVRNQYAKAHQMPARSGALDWKEIPSIVPSLQGGN